jgi:hypothetical protein
MLYAGVAHGAWNNELELLSAVRELVTYLPLSNRCERASARGGGGSGKRGGGGGYYMRRGRWVQDRAC